MHSAGSFDFDPDLKVVTFAYREGLELEIKAHASGGVVGYIITPINNTPDFIAEYVVEIADANSWSEIHQTFLPNPGFNRRAVCTGRNLGPMSKDNSRWILRAATKDDKDCLMLYDNTTTVLCWPNNDPSTVEVWRLTLAPAYKTRVNELQLKGLHPVHLLVRWDRIAAAFAALKWMPGPGLHAPLK